MHEDTEVADLAGWARALGLPHDRARLAELAPEIARLRAATGRLHEIDAGGHEMSIGFRPDARARDE